MRAPPLLPRRRLFLSFSFFFFLACSFHRTFTLFLSPNLCLCLAISLPGAPLRRFLRQRRGRHLNPFVSTHFASVSSVTSPYTASYSSLIVLFDRDIVLTIFLAIVPAIFLDSSTRNVHDARGTAASRFEKKRRTNHVSNAKRQRRSRRPTINLASPRRVEIEEPFTAKNRCSVSRPM